MGLEGIEPSTNRLKAGCSTTELQTLSLKANNLELQNAFTALLNKIWVLLAGSKIDQFFVSFFALCILASCTCTNLMHRWLFEPIAMPCPCTLPCPCTEGVTNRRFVRARRGTGALARAPSVHGHAKRGKKKHARFVRHASKAHVKRKSK